MVNNRTGVDTLTRLAAAGRAWSTAVLGFALTLIALYSAGIGTIEEFYHRGGVVALTAVAVILSLPLAHVHPVRSRGLRSLFHAIDVILAVGIVASIYWFFAVSEKMWTGIFLLGPWDVAFGLMGMIILIELTRRALGPPLAILGALALLYTVFGADLPWIFRHAGFSLEQTVETVWYSLDGVFGLAASVMVGLIYVYIVFGAILEGTGAGQILLKIATAVTGALRGGPAHAAVVSSALFGTISGSAAANVVGTGVFTIPISIRRGFSRPFSGGLEAAASTGGQFLPPVMGAAAFMMAELTGISYLLICVAALVPALLYLGNLFCVVSVEAGRLRLEPIPKEQRQRLTASDWLQSCTFVFPVFTIIAVLLAGRTPAMAGFVATLTAIAVALMLNPQVRRHPTTLLGAMSRGGIAGAKIMVAVAVIGILIGVINLTGLGLRFSNLILYLGEGSLFLSLLATMVACIFLGMGLPTLPAYLVVVVVMGPALQQLGVPLLVAHLFVFYFAALSAVTPPVAIAAYAAAPLAQANPIVTAILAARIALVGFVVPFAFVYNTSLLLIVDFDPMEFVWIVVRLGLVIWLLATALSGFDRQRLAWWSIVARLGLGIVMLVPVLGLQMVSFVLAGLLLGFDRYRNRQGNTASGGPATRRCSEHVIP